jgi:hypothetical protein
MSIDEITTAVEPEPEAATAVQDNTTLRTNTRPCDACTSEKPTADLALLRCDDVYCAECLTRVFRTAMTDETMFPPSCCGMRIRLKTAQTFIPKDVCKKFRAKELELMTKDKTYCWRPRCSAFIAPHSIHNSEAHCQKCRAVTCSRCKSKAHFGQCTNAGDEAFFEFISKTKFKKCPVCKRMVEKNGGCNHVM